MQRIRIFGRVGDCYEYRKTVFMPNTDVAQTGEALVRHENVGVGDVAYWGDFFLRLDSLDGGPRWTQLPADRPELRGLYAAAVEAEQPVGDPWR